MLTKTESNNGYSIKSEDSYYYFFENGLDSAVYSFTFTATDSEANENTKTSSLVIS